jgi:hypothetical protein
MVEHMDQQSHIKGLIVKRQRIPVKDHRPDTVHETEITDIDGGHIESALHQELTEVAGTRPDIQDGITVG